MDEQIFLGLNDALLMTRQKIRESKRREAFEYGGYVAEIAPVSSSYWLTIERESTEDIILGHKGFETRQDAKNYAVNYIDCLP